MGVKRRKPVVEPVETSENANETTRPVGIPRYLYSVLGFASLAYFQFVHYHEDILYPAKLDYYLFGVPIAIGYFLFRNRLFHATSALVDVFIRILVSILLFGVTSMCVFVGINYWYAGNSAPLVLTPEIEKIDPGKKAILVVKLGNDRQFLRWESGTVNGLALEKPESLKITIHCRKGLVGTYIVDDYNVLKKEN